MGDMHWSQAGGRGQSAGGHSDGSALDDQPADAHRPAAGRGLVDPAALTRGPGEEWSRDDCRCRCTQRRPGSVDETADGTVAEAERVGNLLVASPFQSRAKHDLALKSRQGGHPGERLARGKALLGLMLDARPRWMLEQCDGVSRRLAEIGDRDVVNDAVKPGPHFSDLATVADRHPRLEECLLQHILRACLRAHEPAAVGQQLTAIALNQRLERALVARLGQLEQPGIGLGLQEADRGGEWTHGIRPAVGRLLEDVGWKPHLPQSDECFFDAIASHRSHACGRRPGGGAACTQSRTRGLREPYDASSIFFQTAPSLVILSSAA